MIDIEAGLLALMGGGQREVELSVTDNGAVRVVAIPVRARFAKRAAIGSSLESAMIAVADRLNKYGKGRGAADPAARQPVPDLRHGAAARRAARRAPRVPGAGVMGDLTAEHGTRLIGGRCADHREATCPGAESVSSWGAHAVPASEELLGPRRQCFTCAEADGVPIPGYPELTAGVET